MTVYLGSRATIYLNSYDVIKEAFVKNGISFAGRPNDYFYMTELGQSRGDSMFFNFFLFILFAKLTLPGRRQQSNGYYAAEV